jgi:hypothetical protein
VPRYFRFKVTARLRSRLRGGVVDVDEAVSDSTSAEIEVKAVGEERKVI